VDQRRCLQCLAGRFLGELSSGQAAKFVVNQRQQLIGRLRFALLNRLENAVTSDIGRALLNMTAGHSEPRTRILDATAS